MANIEVYSGPFCPYCVRAKRLLSERGLAFTEYDVHADPHRRTEMLARAEGARTIPQIFINGRHVGGCDELYALDRRGELAAWLANAA
jgi:glutaredoxin 3